MKRIKNIIVLAVFSLMTGIFSAYAQGSDSSVSSSAMSTTAQNTQTAQHTDMTGYILVGVACLVILGIVIAFMVRDRRKTIGGIQSQSKPQPVPTTTDTINNPASGI
jgi:beta-lactamase regulating signal transducer with metallopeptidase domain